MSHDTRGESVDEVLQALGTLRACARRWSQDEAAAEDLLQDTAERAMRALDRLRPDTCAVAWLRRIMYHLAIDETRRQRRQRVVFRRYRHEAEPWQEPPALEQAPPPPAREVTVAEVRRASDDMREPVRSTFQLWAMGRLSYKEISARQRIPVSTVGTRLLRARRELRGLLLEATAQP